MRSSTWVSPLFAVVAMLSFVAASGAEAPVPPVAAEPAAAVTADADCAAEASPEVATLFAVAEAPVCAAETAAPVSAPEPEPIFQQGPPQLRRFCHCGCGVPCTTDDDCGAGGRCVAFVTCC